MPCRWLGASSSWRLPHAAATAATAERRRAGSQTKARRRPCGSRKRGEYGRKKGEAADAFPWGEVQDQERDVDESQVSVSKSYEHGSVCGLSRLWYKEREATLLVIGLLRPCVSSSQGHQGCSWRLQLAEPSCLQCHGSVMASVMGSHAAGAGAFEGSFSIFICEQTKAQRGRKALDRSGRLSQAPGHIGSC